MDKEEVLKLLNSSDIEIRKLAETYLIENFDLNFKIRCGFNINSRKYECIKINLDKDYIDAKNPKDIIHNYVIYRTHYFIEYVKQILEVIYEHNHR